MYQEADPAGFDEVTAAIASLHAVAEVEIASALEYAHARAAAVIAEAEAQAESIRAGVNLPSDTLVPAPAPVVAAPLTAPSPHSGGRDWFIPVEAVLPMVALVLLLVVVVVVVG